MSMDIKFRNAKCKVCKKLFAQRSSLHCVCTMECALKYQAKIVKSAAIIEREAAVERRRAHKLRIETMKPLTTLRAEAQTAFNAYIRLRDRLAGHGCICCGEPLDWHSTKPGGAVDAGHFVSRGAAIELAFDERNVNAQRKGCNRPGGTTRAKFVAGMTARYGADVVAELEGPHDLPRLRHDDLRQIRNTYRAKVRELKKELL